MRTPKHDRNWVIIGKIGRPVGLKGLMLINLFSEIPKNINNFYYFNDNLGWQAISLKLIDNKIAVENILSPEQARAWTNKYIAIKRTDLPELSEKEYYLHDLIEMQVKNQQGFDFGIVTEITDFGAQPNLICQKNKQSYIIPMLESTIIHKDFHANIITVAWDEKID